ncbi:MAG: CoA-binding protein [Chitinophagaceae bacterium]|nr:CoA-binding protein [Chitinophagaceae bacterium]
MKQKALTLILGASDNPARYSNLAAHRLKGAGYPFRALGIKTGEVAGVGIETGQPDIQDVDTITLYVGPANQAGYYEYIKKLNPRRVIFNPGTENEAFQQELEASGIHAIEACTLVMLSTGQF